MCSLVKILVTAFNNHRLNRVVSNRNALFKYVKQNSHTPMNIPVINYNNKFHTEPNDKAKIFASVFQKSFNNIPDHNAPSLANPSCNVLTDVDFDVNTVMNILKYLPPKNSTSPDNIPYIFLKNCRTAFSLNLTDLFRNSLDSGDLPTQWKQSIIIPLHKKGSKSDPENYRPISLTSTTLRVFERIILQAITSFLHKNHFFSNCQHGFLQNRSTSTQLISSFEQWYKAISKNQSIDIAYIDFQKAFDSVPLNFLLSKLYHISIRGKLHKWLYKYLHNRTFTVRINNSSSQPKPVLSGVPQGSVLEPLLFLIYINDLPLSIPPSVSTRLFADDVKIFHIYQELPRSPWLQNALNCLAHWSRLWCLPISVNKTFILSVPSKNIPPTQFTLNNQPITFSSSVKDLGITFSSNLDFSEHIQNIVKLANFRSFQLLRTIHSFKPKIWSIAFKTYVRPILEYCPEIWNPRSKKLIFLIENVQKIYSRNVMKKCKLPKFSYSERLKLLDLPSLYSRRMILELTTLFKIIKGLTHLKPETLLSISERPSRYHPYQIQYARQNSISSQSLIVRNTKKWNSLPLDIVTSPSVPAFKTKLTNFIHNTNSPLFTCDFSSSAL